MEVSTLFRFAEAVLAFDLNVVKAVCDIQTCDLATLYVGGERHERGFEFARDGLPGEVRAAIGRQDRVAEIEKDSAG